MKHLLLSCWFLLSLPLMAQDFDFSLSGRWVRIDDAWEGMELDVIFDNDDFVGTLIMVPDPARKAGFETGKIKWRGFERISAEAYDFQDLYSRDYGLGYYSFHYGRTHMVIVSGNEIVMQVYNPAGVLIGAKQRWIKLPPM
jgi:hypothetical protein